MFMQKDEYYFQHDYNPTNDPKMICLLGDLGGVGYGIYWRIIEMLHQEKGNKLPFKTYIYEAIAKQLLVSTEQIERFITDCIKKYELFDSDDGFFWSCRVLRNIEKRDEKRKQKSEAGKKGMNNRWHKPITGDNTVITKITKERKGKERKGKESKGNKNFIIPTAEEVTEYGKTIDFVIDGSRFCDYYQARGWLIGKNKIKDWRACVRTWKSKQNESKANLKMLSQITEKIGVNN
jgi:hypothetical protein